MKLRKNNRNWEIDFTKLEIFGLVFLLLIGTGMAVTTIYDVGSTASAIASNMTVAGVLNVTNVINSTSRVEAVTFRDGTATLTAGALTGVTELNASDSTIGTLYSTLIVPTTANITHATITNPIFTTANGTAATIGTLYSTLIVPTTATITTANVATLNVSTAAVLPAIMPTAAVGAIYYNSTFDCLTYYNSTDWKCSNGTVLVG